MNQVFPDGSVVYFVKSEDLPAVEGSYVVAVARRGDLYETTLKQFGRDSKGALALFPRSTDPRHQRPIYPKKTGAESVEVMGTVVGVFHQMPLPPAPFR